MLAGWLSPGGGVERVADPKSPPKMLVVGDCSTTISEKPLNVSSMSGAVTSLGEERDKGENDGLKGSGAPMDLSGLPIMESTKLKSTLWLNEAKDGSRAITPSLAAKVGIYQ